MNFINSEDQKSIYYGALAAIISFKFNYAGSEYEISYCLKDPIKEKAFIESFLAELELSDLDVEVKDMFIRCFMSTNDNNIMMNYMRFIDLLKSKGRFVKWFNRGLKQYDKVIDPLVLNLEKRLGVKENGAIFADEIKYADLVENRNTNSDNAFLLDKFIKLYTQYVTGKCVEQENQIFDSETRVCANLNDYRKLNPHEFNRIGIKVRNNPVYPIKKRSILQRVRSKVILNKLNKLDIKH